MYCVKAKLWFNQGQQPQKEPDGPMNKLKLPAHRDTVELSITVRL